MEEEDELDGFLIILVIAALVAFIMVNLGCAVSPVATQPAAPPAVNKFDMFGTINGQSFTGAGVIPIANSYDMKISSRADVNMIMVQTCHRNFTADDVIKQGWLQQNRTYDYKWTPAPGIEDSGSCLIRIGSYNKNVGGQNAWAIIDVETPDMTLPAVNECDGDLSEVKGVSMCQTKAGLIERLIFDVPVKVDTAAIPVQCRGLLDLAGKVWEYQAGLGECVVIFDEVAVPHRMHRHTTEGYNNVIYRGGS